MTPVSKHLSTTVLACVSTAAVSAHAVPIVDQGTLFTDTATGGSAIVLPFGGDFLFPDETDALQTFTVGVDGMFTGVRLQMSAELIANFNLEVSVVEVIGDSTIGTQRASATITPAQVPTSQFTNPTTVELGFDRFAVISGERLGILIEMDGPAITGYDIPLLLRVGDATEFSGIEYAGGNAFDSSNGGPFRPISVMGINDIPFQTLVEPTPPGCNPADITGPFDVLDLGDIDAFIAAFMMQDTAADIAAPFGVFDLGDIDTFIRAFQAGCF
ncbi:MAG: GC-type dockerin domain-anchored protein [Planctomycetota bacterium]